jgi:hypothetical protein
VERTNWKASEGGPRTKKVERRAREGRKKNNFNFSQEKKENPQLYKEKKSLAINHHKNELFVASTQVNSEI